MTPQHVGSVTRTTIARMYGVKIDLFNSWIEINPVLKKLYEPYMKKKLRALPPVIMQQTFAILGNPE